jgi:hypothetical protein
MGRVRNYSSKTIFSAALAEYASAEEEVPGR